MRSAVLIFIPLAVLAAVFYFLILDDRPPAPTALAATRPTTRRFVPTTLGALRPDAGVIGQTGNVWVQSLSRRTRRLASEFRAERFDPRPDGAVDVARPQARFYGENGGIVTLDGTSGKVSLTQPGERSDPEALGASTPTAGELRDVTIRFYETSLDEEPTIVVTVRAIHFDALGNRISTIDDVVNGKGVMAEQVPVTVTGRDVEFNGEGLTMRWNDREGRLDYLEIHKGERLLIKNLASLGGTRPRPAAAVAPLPEPAFAPAAALFGLVAADLAPATTKSTTPATTRAALARRELYHATFDRDVRVTRDGRPIAAADVMRVALPLGEDKADRAETPTAEDRARRARRRDRAASNPSTAPVSRPAAAPRAASIGASTTPATAPAGPIDIRWSGRLIVRPASSVEGSPQEQMVELVGSPAWVSENGGRVDARLIHIEPESGRLRVEPGGPVRAIQVHDAGGADLRSRSPLVIDRSAGAAQIEGGGTLVTPAADGRGAPTTVTWSKRLAVKLEGADDPWLREIAIEGDARVSSDQLKLASATLALGFDRPTSRLPAEGSDTGLPAADLALLRSVDARGAARMDVGAGDVRRSLAGESIRLDMVAGDGVAAALERVRCAGDVALDDASGFSLTCGDLDVRTRPIPLDAGARPERGGDPLDDPLDDVVRLTATDAVRLKQADGNRAEGDRVELLTEGGVRQMRLSGAPARVATDRGTLDGDQIVFDPATGNVDVPGPGKFSGVDDRRAGDAMTIAWLDSMTADGTTGACVLSGGVKLDGTNADGTRLRATANRGVLQFATRAATTTPTTTAPATTTSAVALGTPDVALDALRSVQLSDGVDVAMQTDARSSSVQTQWIDIDLERGMVSSPQAGRMLVVDVRPTSRPATPPVDARAAAPTTAPANGTLGPGSLALAWQDELLWQMREGTLTIRGGVRLGFEREASDDPIRMTCERVVCGLTPITGDGVDGLARPVELRSVSAERSVSVRSRLASFDASALRFDAATNRATATGTPETPVEVFDAQATSRVGFSSIVWNVETGLIEDFRDIRGQLRR